MRRTLAPWVSFAWNFLAVPKFRDIWLADKVGKIKVA